MSAGSIIDCELKSGDTNERNIFKCELLSEHLFDQVNKYETYFHFKKLSTIYKV
jgi:hypothetical protein